MTNSLADESQPCDSSEEVAMMGNASLQSLADLEDQLQEERKRSRSQEQELNRMQALVEQLETLVDRQVSVTESEHDRIAMLEQAMGEQQTGTEEKVAKLLLAVAGEKRRADMAEQKHSDLERNQRAVVEGLSRQVDAAHAASLSSGI